MDPLQIPSPFTTSYSDFQSYPSNLVYKTSYPAALRACRTLLDDASSRIFTAEEEEIQVPFRDYVDQTSMFERHNVLRETALKERLGDRSTVDPVTLTLTGSVATKKDPKCRFIFLYGGHSRRPLRITKVMMLRILSYHQVMTGFLDFISVFGSSLSGNAYDLKFSGFREQSTFNTRTPDLRIEDLRRSGRQFQLTYNLKGVACLSDPTEPIEKQQWSIRQAVFHHQFDIEYGTTLWIVAKGDLDMKERIQDMTGKDGRLEDKSFGAVEECFKSSLAVHLLLCHWAIEKWRWYIQWLEYRVEKDTILAVYDARNDLYTTQNLLTIQIFEDRANETIMILEANIDILVSLRNFYQRLTHNTDFPLRQICQRDISAFSLQLNDLINDLKNQTARAGVLVRITADRKSIMSHHLQEQATRANLKLNLSIHSMGVLSQKEAIKMGIVTVVTLIYLPATFVSTFFSTDIVKYQNQNEYPSDGTFMGSFSQIALLRWLQVTLPLTFLTLVIGFLWYRRAEQQREQSQAADGLPFTWQDAKSSLSG